MFDYTACRNENCDVKLNCYRFMGEQHPQYQSMANFVRGYTKDWDCFWELRDGMPTRKLEIDEGTCGEDREAGVADTASEVLDV